MSYEKNLYKDRRFWPLFWTQFFGAFNDNVFKNALVILITFKAYSLLSFTTEQMVALCGGIFILPFFLFSALAGQISDKLPKHSLMLKIKIAEIIIMTIGACGFLFENIQLLLVSLFFMGLQSTFFGPAKYSILPELLEENELVHGNALIEMGTFLSILIGTILGSLLMSLEGIGKFYVSASVIIFAMIGTFFSSKIQTLQAQNPKLSIKYGLIKPTYEIIKISRKIKSIFHSILAISWFWFFGAALLSIFPVYVKNTLHADEKVVTLFLAMFSIGVAIGSKVCEKMSRRHLELGLVPIGSIGISLFVLDLYFVGVPSFVTASSESALDFLEFVTHFESIRILVDLLLLSVFSGFFIVPLYTFIQQRSNKEERSRVIAANNILNAFFMVMGSLFLTFLYALKVEIYEIFLILSIMNALIAIYVYTVIPEFLWRFVCVILSRLIYRVKVQGLEHIPIEGPAVLVCNHVSFVDWLIIAACIPRPVRFVMHYSFLKIPMIKFIFRGAKVIPIAGGKENHEILEEAFQVIAHELREGEIVCLFPEGMITKDGKLNSYKKGIEQIIKTTPVPVIPMALKGLWGSFFSRKWNEKALSKPSVIRKTIWSPVQLIITTPVPPESVNAHSLELQTQELLK